VLFENKMRGSGITESAAIGSHNIILLDTVRIKTFGVGKLLRFFDFQKKSQSSRCCVNCSPGIFETYEDYVMDI